MQRLGHLIAVTDVVGGVGTVIAGLLEAAQDAGVRDEVLVARTHGTPERYRPWPLPWERRPDLVEAADRVDVLVVHGVFSPAVARAAAVLRRSRPQLPMIAFPRDAYDPGLFARRRVLKSAYFAFVERPLLRGCAAVLTTAPSHERWLRRRKVGVQVRTAPLGLSSRDLAAAHACAVSWTSRAPGPPRVLILGRWDIHEKGLDLALNAVSGLPDVRLRLVGPTLGADPQLRALANRAADRITLVGYRDDIWAEMAEADLVLMPSRKEGFGIVGLQALAAGVPLVLSTRAGLADYVGAHPGVTLVEPHVLEVQNGLHRALGRLDELREGARRFALEEAAGWTYAPLRAALAMPPDTRP